MRAAHVRKLEARERFRTRIPEKQRHSGARCRRSATSSRDWAAGS
jgi:hypothetical protein